MLVCRKNFSAKKTIKAISKFYYGASPMVLGEDRPSDKVTPMSSFTDMEVSRTSLLGKNTIIPDCGVGAVGKYTSMWGMVSMITSATGIPRENTPFRGYSAKWYNKSRI